MLKHIVLVRVLLHLRGKDSAFRVIDTHAGAGRYDLTADPALRTGEWRDGIGRLIADPPGGEAAALLDPYLALIRAENPTGEITAYPGSPAIALALTRPRDRMLFCEMQPDERAALSAVVGRDRRAKVIEIDGWLALKAYVPPPERRGLVLVDPPFEAPGEFERLERGLAEAHRRWAGGTYLLWYPIKDRREVETFARRVSHLGIPKILRIELEIRAPQAGEALRACGMLAVNPPWTLENELAALMPALARLLARDAPVRTRVDWLTP